MAAVKGFRQQNAYPHESSTFTPFSKLLLRLLQTEARGQSRRLTAFE